MPVCWFDGLDGWNKDSAKNQASNARRAFPPGPNVQQGSLQQGPLHHATMSYCPPLNVSQAGSPVSFPWLTSYLDPLGFIQVALSKPGPLIEQLVSAVISQKCFQAVPRMLPSGCSRRHPPPRPTVLLGLICWVRACSIGNGWELKEDVVWREND
jgi:hypothetical protein